jgi:hypothetical protein
MADAQLGAFESGFASWSRILSNSANDDARLQNFRHCTTEVASYVTRGLEKATAVDELVDLAASHGLTENIGIENVEGIIAKAFEPKVNGEDSGGLGEQQQDYTAKAALNVVPIIFPFPIKGDDIPRRPWIIPGLLLRRHVTMLVAPPGSGKSLFTLQLGMVCAAGLTNWGGWRLRGPVRVLVINSEEDKDEMHRRLFAGCKVMNLDEDSLAASFAFAEAPDDIVIAKADARTKTVTRTPMIERIQQTIIAGQFDILIVDPFAETFIGDENSNSELKWACVLWREVARKTNCCVLLVHHTRKFAQDMAGDMDAARGAGALAGICRVVCTLFGMTDQEAERHGLTADKRTRYLRLDDAKSNLTLVTPIAKWFEKISIQLPNAGDDLPADEVGVLMPWKALTAFDKMSSVQANAMLDEFVAGYQEDDGMQTGDPFSPTPARGSKPKRWAGYVIQRHLNCSEKDAADILASWVGNGIVTVFKQVVKTGKKRGNVPTDCIRVVDGMRPGKELDRAEDMQL